MHVLKNNDIVLLIPVYNPDEKFIEFLEQLTVGGWREIIVVDDGSKLETQHFFQIAEEQYYCQIVKHHVNLGQGRAFKSGFNYFIGKYGKNPDIIGIIECDCDGQHILEDVEKCASLLRENKDKFILGVRNFDDKNIPFRSRFGNKCTNFIFKFFCGLDIKDTQTGLKGIPARLVYDLIETNGERFEYASSVLLAVKGKGVDIVQFDINTIYIDDNAASHFNPIADSVRIYSLIFRYLASSLSTVVIDLIAFAIFTSLLSNINNHTYLSSLFAKIFSGSFNFCVNKLSVFKSSGHWGSELVKYILLCLTHVFASATLINFCVNGVKMPEVLAKIIVDSLLFIAVYYIQSMWVFKKKKCSRGNKNAAIQ